MSVLLAFSPGQLFMCLPRIDPDSHDTSANGLGPIRLLQARTAGFERWTGRVLGCVAILAWLNGMSQFLDRSTTRSSAQFPDALQYPFGYRGSFASLSVLSERLVSHAPGYILRKSVSLCIKAVFLSENAPSAGVAYAVSNGDILRAIASGRGCDSGRDRS